MRFLALLGFCECGVLDMSPLIDALVCGKRGLSGEHGAFVAGGSISSSGSSSDVVMEESPTYLVRLLVHQRLFTLVYFKRISKIV